MRTNKQHADARRQDVLDAKRMGDNRRLLIAVFWMSHFAAMALADGEIGEIEFNDYLALVL